MTATQNIGRRLAFWLTDSTSGIGVTSIPFDDVGLHVYYTKHADTQTELTLTVDTWHEIGNGVYTVDFPATCFSVLGEFIHTCTYDGDLGTCTDYIGIIDVITNPLGTGNITWVHTVTVNSTPYAGATVVYYSDSAYVNAVANGITDALGQVTFMLNAGTYYVKVYIPGSDVVTDTEVVS
jgi:hypothetical protein